MPCPYNTAATYSCRDPPRLLTTGENPEPTRHHNKRARCSRAAIFVGRNKALTVENPLALGCISADPAKRCAKVFAKTLQKTDIVTTIQLHSAGILLHLIKQGD